MTVDRSSFVDDSGETRFAGSVQPGAGTSAGDVLTSQGDGEPAGWAPAGGSSPFTGWTGDDQDPASVSTNGGALIVGTDDDASYVAFHEPGESEYKNDEGETVVHLGDIGVESAPSNNAAAFTASDANGATVAIDGGNLPGKNFAEGSDPSDAATVSQLGGSSSFLCIEMGETVTVPNTGDTTVLTFQSVDQQQGTGITLGEDGQTVTVTDAGVYIAALVIDFNVDDQTGRRAAIIIAPVVGATWLNGAPGTEDKAAGESNVSVSAPFLMAAGQTFKFYALVNGAAGSVDTSFAVASIAGPF